MEIPKVIRDGKVAVLYSPRYGAGWSTWAKGEERELSLFAPSVVEWVENGKVGEVPTDWLPPLNNAALETGNKAYFYTGGAQDLKIAWVTVGTRFRIDEYDGSESIVLDDYDTYVA